LNGCPLNLRSGAIVQQVVAEDTFGEWPPEIEDALPSPADVASFAAEAIEEAGDIPTDS
jgi:hypothetical protein